MLWLVIICKEGVTVNAVVSYKQKYDWSETLFDSLDACTKECILRISQVVDWSIDDSMLTVVRSHVASGMRADINFQELGILNFSKWTSSGSK